MVYLYHMNDTTKQTELLCHSDIFCLGWSKDPGPSAGREVPCHFFWRFFVYERIIGKLSKQLASFIRENYTDFLTYDKIKVYYDNGQIELTRILSLVLNALLPKVEFRRVIPSDYRLFQVADLICTLELERLKMENKMISKHELEFWGKESEFKKNI